MGATVGSAVVGSVFVTRLHDLLAERLPSATANAPVNANSLTPGAVQGLPDAIRLPVIDSYNDALLPIFLFMAPLTLIALVLLFFVVEKPLATKIDRDVVASDSDEPGEFTGTDPALHGTDPAVSDPSPATLESRPEHYAVSSRP